MNNLKRTIVFLFAVLFVICFSSCSNNAYEDKIESTVSLANKYDIDLEATYDKENKKVLTTLTNNTGNLVVYQESEYYLLKKSGSKWKDITPSYADIATNPAPIYPQKGKNVFKSEHPVYDTDFDNSEEAENYVKTSLEPGDYKISVKICVCDPTVYINWSEDNKKTKKFPDFNKNRKEFYLEAHFTVE